MTLKCLPGVCVRTWAPPTTLKVGKERKEAGKREEVREGGRKETFIEKEKGAEESP